MIVSDESLRDYFNKATFEKAGRRVYSPGEGHPPKLNLKKKIIHKNFGSSTSL